MKATDNVYPLSHDGCYSTGIEARDYIAIQAMQAIVASPNFNRAASAPEVAKDAYRIADAMIKQSEVKDEQSV